MGRILYSGKMPDESTIASYEHSPRFGSDIYVAVNKIPNAYGIHRRTLPTDIFI